MMNRRISFRLLKILFAALAALLCALSFAACASAGNVSPSSAAAEGEIAPVVFSFGTAEGKAGESVTVELSISDNPGLAGYSLTLSYDAQALEVLSVENKLSGVAFEYNHSLAERGKLNISATGDGGNTIIQNGVCATVEFRIADGASPGRFPLTLLIDGEEDDVFTDFDASPTASTSSFPVVFRDGAVIVSA